MKMVCLKYNYAVVPWGIVNMNWRKINQIMAALSKIKKKSTVIIIVIIIIAIIISNRRSSGGI